MRGKGFTLVELLVTIAILTTLMAIAFISFTSIQKTSRDAKRQSDLKVIQGALEQYHADQGFYPTSSFDNLIGTANPFKDPSNLKTYLQKIPTDPVDNTHTYVSQYKYIAKPISPSVCDNTTTNGYCTSYCLYGNLENGDARIPSCDDDSNRNFEISPP